MRVPGAARRPYRLQRESFSSDFSEPLQHIGFANLYLYLPQLGSNVVASHLALTYRHLCYPYKALIFRGKLVPLA